MNAAWHFGHLCLRFLSPSLVTILNTLPLIPSVEVAENMSVKRSRTNDKMWSYSLLFGEGINSHFKKWDCVKCHKRPRCGTDCSERRQPREINISYGTWMWVIPLIRLTENSARRITKYTLDVRFDGSAGGHMGKAWHSTGRGFYFLLWKDGIFYT